MIWTELILMEIHLGLMEITCFYYQTEWQDSTAGESGSSTLFKLYVYIFLWDMVDSSYLILELLPWHIILVVCEPLMYW